VKLQRTGTADTIFGRVGRVHILSAFWGRLRMSMDMRSADSPTFIEGHRPSYLFSLCRVAPIAVTGVWVSKSIPVSQNT
jgi:hypothetical protein